MSEEMKINPAAPIPGQLPRKLPEEGEGIKKRDPEPAASEKAPADAVELSPETLAELERLKNEPKE